MQSSIASKAVSLALDQPRVVVIKQNENRFTYRFRRITERDWKNYYNGIANQTETLNGKQVRVFDYRTALQTLVESTLESVEGYNGPGGAPVQELKEWKTKLPLGHKITVGLVLADVSTDEAGSTNASADACLIPEFIETTLRARWSADHSEDTWTMTEYRGLIHRFMYPELEHVKRFNRQSSRAVVIVGGSKTETTILPGHQESLAKFYDELIVSVDGYSFAGDPLTDQVETIKAEMDMQHKVAAARALFSGGNEAEVG